MMEWTPANEQDVAAAIDAEWVGIDPSLKDRLSAYMVKPQAALIERFGRVEQAFIVARIGRHVVFFDDVENTFSNAVEGERTLSEASDYGNLILALRELERVGENGS